MSTTKYVIELTKEEALLLQKIRSIKFGSVKAHIVESKVVRIETTDSELMSEKSKEAIIIKVESVIESN